MALQRCLRRIYPEGDSTDDDGAMGRNLPPEMRQRARLLPNEQARVTRLTTELFLGRCLTNPLIHY